MSDGCHGKTAGSIIHSAKAVLSCLHDTTGLSPAEQAHGVPFPQQSQVHKRKLTSQ